MANAKKSFYYKNKKPKSNMDNLVGPRVLSPYPTDEENYKAQIQALSRIEVEKDDTDDLNDEDNFPNNQNHPNNNPNHSNKKEIKTHKNNKVNRPQNNPNSINTSIPQKETPEVLSPQVLAQIEKNKVFIEQYNQNKVMVDTVFTYIKQRTGKNIKIIAPVIDDCANKKLGLQLINESGTNFAGLCLLYEECDLLEYAIEKLGSDQIEVPMIMGMKNFHAVFNKSLVMNECFVNLAKKKNIPTEHLWAGLKEFAPSLLFRQENIVFYLKLVALSKIEEIEVQQFIELCIKENNRPVLAEAVKLGYYTTVLQNVVSNNAASLSDTGSIYLWLQTQLRHNLKIKTATNLNSNKSNILANSEKTIDITSPAISLEITPVPMFEMTTEKSNTNTLKNTKLKVELVSDTQDTAHLSNVEDKMKFLSSGEIVKAPVIVKKKILSKPALG